MIRAQRENYKLPGPSLPVPREAVFSGRGPGEGRKGRGRAGGERSGVGDPARAGWGGAVPARQGRGGAGRRRGRARAAGAGRGGAAGPRRPPAGMWPIAEERRVEQGAEAGQSGGRSWRTSDAGRSTAGAAGVTRERPGPYDLGRSPAVQVLCSQSEVRGRLGTLARAGMERWRDRLALVTGASGGIGAAVARALVQQGLKVVGCARTVGNIEVRPCGGASGSGWRRFRRAWVQVGDGERSEPRCHAALLPQSHLQGAQGQERWMPSWWRRLLDPSGQDCIFAF